MARMLITSSELTGGYDGRTGGCRAEWIIAPEAVCIVP